MHYLGRLDDYLKHALKVAQSDRGRRGARQIGLVPTDAETTATRTATAAATAARGGDEALVIFTARTRDEFCKSICLCPHAIADSHCRVDRVTGQPVVRRAFIGSSKAVHPANGTKLGMKDTCLVGIPTDRQLLARTLIVRTRSKIGE